jgi:hypothetical protein
MSNTSHITSGYPIKGETFLLDAGMVNSYISAVNDSSQIYGASSLVPPTAVAALGVQSVLKALALPPGTLHAAQEISINRSVAIGEKLSCSAQVTQSSQRRDWLFVVVEFNLNNEQANSVLTGRSTLMVPEKGS